MSVPLLLNVTFACQATQLMIIFVSKSSIVREPKTFTVYVITLFAQEDLHIEHHLSQCPNTQSIDKLSILDYNNCMNATLHSVNNLYRPDIKLNA